MNDAIQVHRLRKSYGSHTVLKDLSFRAARGDIFALLGVNGAGKTTALECIEGLRTYDSGRIAVSGKIGVQLQSASLPAHIRPMEAVRLFAKWNHAGVSEATLDALGIAALRKKRYAELSTGQKRRLHLALALAGDPDIVFLDEPTSGLDVEGRLAFHVQIRKLKAQGKTIILASHDMAEVESLCDRIAILSGGYAAFCGTVLELTEKLGRRYTLRIRTSLGEEVFESGDIGDTMLTLLEDFKRRNISILDIKADRGTLEEHFINITGRNGT